jgi:tetratricopeptide (TPR) repeat protein
MKRHRLAIAATCLALAATAPAWAQQVNAPTLAEGEKNFQGKSLLGEDMFTIGPNPVNVAKTPDLLRAVAEAKAAFEKELTIDNATWYGRLLAYQGLMKQSIEVYTIGLKKFPDSAKLLRHRAHRYFSLRDFDKSVEDGLKSAKLYEGKPLEREKLGPDYFPSTPDIVQTYAYYHLGQAYFAKHDYVNAAKWFQRAGEVAIGVHSAPDYTASVYWTYLSLARGGRYGEAEALLKSFTYTLNDVKDNKEANYYFDAIQMFKDLRDPESFFSTKDSGKAFSTSDGIAASSGYSIANYYILRGEVQKAKPMLARAVKVDTFSYFARIQAESDWVLLFGNEKP